MFWGLAVLVIGVLYLFKNVGYISGNTWDIIWPCLVIIFGLTIVFKNKNISFPKKGK